MGASVLRRPLLQGPQLVPHQEAALLEWRARGRRGIVVMPTGGGKTEVGVEAIAEVLGRGRSVLVLVPTTALREQWRRKLFVQYRPLLEAAARAAGLEGRPEALVRVVTHQAAAVHAGEPHAFGMPGLVVVDECHHFKRGSKRAQWLRGYLEREPDAWVLGLTAVPGERLRADGVTDAVGPVVYEAPARALLVAGMLAPAALEEVEAPSREEVPRAAAEAAARLAAEGEKVLVLCRTVAEAEEVYRRLREMGVENVFRLYGAQACARLGIDRGRELEEFRRCDHGVLVATPIGEEGVDVPDATAVVFVGATESPRRLLQGAGRALRVDVGKIAKVVAVGTPEQLERFREAARDCLVVVGCPRWFVETYRALHAERVAARARLPQLRRVEGGLRYALAELARALGVSPSAASMILDPSQSERLFALAASDVKYRYLLLGAYLLEKYARLRLEGRSREAAWSEAVSSVLRDVKRLAARVTTDVSEWLARPERMDLKYVDEPRLVPGATRSELERAVKHVARVAKRVAEIVDAALEEGWIRSRPRVRAGVRA